MSSERERACEEARIAAIGDQCWEAQKKQIPAFLIILERGLPELPTHTRQMVMGALELHVGNLLHRVATEDQP